MRENEIKLLWGRSGNRCSICKLELTPDGEPNTIGEMAHIVARSVDGPRGKSDLSAEGRDRYENLILLCPNNHAEIDNNPEKWPVELLKKVKAEHEEWVSERLDKGLISVIPIDNSKFIDERLNSWFDFSNGSIWLAVSITPLRIGGDTLNPLDPAGVGAVNAFRIPTDSKTLQPVNRYHTRPNENGLINDDLRNVNKGYGHRVQLFRNGQCEFLLCLQGSTSQLTSYAREKASLGVEDRMLRYTDLAQAIKAGIEGLHFIWKCVLPFKDMTLNIFVLNTERCFLYSREGKWGETVQGYPVESNTLRVSDVIDREETPKMVFESAIKQLVNYFGLVLNQVLDEKGELIRPEKFTTHI